MHIYMHTYIHTFIHTYIHTYIQQQPAQQQQDASAGEPASGASAKGTWTQHVDKGSGRTYYYNTGTQCRGRR